MKGVVATGLLAAALLGAPAALAGKVEFAVTSVQVSARTHDRAPKGASKGDAVVYRDRLVNAKAQFGRPKGARIGSDRGTMTFTSAHGARFSGAARLPGGTVVLRGPVIPLSNGDLAIPVAGGTGRYAKAKGVVVVGPGSKRALNTYALELPSGGLVA